MASPSTALSPLSLHDALPICACLRGLGKLQANPLRLAADLEANWEVLAEAVQQVMRRFGEHRSEEHTSELQSRENLVCRLLLEKKKKLRLPRTLHVLHGQDVS